MRFRTAAATVAASAFVAGSFIAVSPANAEPEVTEADVEKAFDQAEAANETLNQLTEDADDLDARIDEVGAEIRKIRKVFTVQRDELGADIVQQQLEQPLGPTVGLLASQDPDLFIEGLSAIDALNTTRADALESFTRTRVELEKRQTQLAEHERELDAKLAKAEKTKKKLVDSYQKAKSDFALLSAAQQSEMNAGDVDAVQNAGAGAAKKAIAFAMSQLGEPYVYGGTGPDSWDCSGLVMKAYAAAGVSLPRVVGPQMSAGRSVSAGDLAPGDLVAYPSMSHIGIYLGGGKVIHAPRPGKSVEITSLSSGFGVYARVS
ncbi:C40 family peptidase [Aeromicrobium choanae]|uniref:Cell wall-associated hydrolase, NlpC family n=1 Tax=Aeromicrobium choanae TaxID=1736691 RepID=A0A1T4Z7S6_9ACTN|nr:C40 family peptidase [Aeromicrobium choanae]SKB09615.1 Cell wall-associated hydrolase, NlpC family [Aeromicrobium choanae]